MITAACFCLLLPLILCYLYFFFFFFNDTATTEIYTLSLHDALPICPLVRVGVAPAWKGAPCRRHRFLGMAGRRSATAADDLGRPRGIDRFDPGRRLDGRAADDRRVTLAELPLN